MAGSLSTALHNKLLDHILKTTPFVVPTDIYVSLYSVAPTKAGGGTELTGNGYVRIVHNSWNAAAAEAATNDGAITFAAASGGDWLEAVAFGVHDAITAGNFLGWGDLTTARTVLENDDARFADTILSVEIAEV